MAFDTYLDITGVVGECTAAGFEKKIEIYAFSWGASNPTSVGPGRDGLSAGRVAVSSFMVSKKTEKSSAALFAACCTGQHFDKATVSMRKATGTGGQDIFLTYTFTDVMVESVQWSGSSGGDDTPSESLTLAFAKVEIEYKTQDDKGKLAVAGQASWDSTKVSA